MEKLVVGKLLIWAKPFKKNYYKSARLGKDATRRCDLVHTWQWKKAY